MFLIVGHRTPHSPPQADQIIRRAHTILIRFHCDVAILNACGFRFFFTTNEMAHRDFTWNRTCGWRSTLDLESAVSREHAIVATFLFGK